MCTYFKAETEDHSPGEKYGGAGLASERAEALNMQKLRNSGSSRQ